MENNISMEAMDLSFKILETILILKDYKTKAEVLKVANVMRGVALNSDEYPKTIKDAYIEAYKKLDGLTFEEMMEIKEIIED